MSAPSLMTTFIALVMERGLRRRSGCSAPLQNRKTPLLLLTSSLHAPRLHATLRRMATPITISIPHQLGRVEARRRIETGFASLTRQLPGGGTCNEHWDGDQLTFSAAGMGQTISGAIDVLDDAVTIRIDLPGVLGMIASGLKGRLEKAGQLLLTKK